MNLSLNRKESLENRIFFYLLFFGVLVLSLTVLKPLLSLVILALLISTLFQPVYEWLMRKLKGKKSFAVPLTLISVFLSLIIPFTVIVIISIGQINIFISDLSEFAGNSEEIQDILNSGDGYDSTLDTELVETSVQELITNVNGLIDQFPFIDDEETIVIDDVRTFIGDVASSVAVWVGDTALNVIKNTPVFITNLIVFIIILSTFIPSQERLKDYFLKISPLDNRIDKLYLEKTEAMANDMVKGTFVVAIVQGIIWGILYWISGVPYVMFWVLISVFLSLIPNGGSIINWPLVIALFISGNFAGAIVLLLGNLLIIGTSENILRPMLVSEKAYIHPALTLLGIVGGIQVFGFLGFIYGPVIMILLATTIDIYVNHYKNP